MKHLLKHLQLDRADAAATAQPRGTLNSTLGKHQEMRECSPSLRELPQKLTVFFLLMENADPVFFLPILVFLAFFSNCLSSLFVLLGSFM